MGNEEGDQVHQLAHVTGALLKSGHAKKEPRSPNVEASLGGGLEEPGAVWSRQALRQLPLRVSIFF